MIFIYDGMFDGFLSAVFDAYNKKITPLDIVSELSDFQMTLGGQYHHVHTSPEKVSRVSAGMTRIGDEFERRVLFAFYSNFPGREIAILRYIQLGLKVGSDVLDMLAHDTVRAVVDMARQTGRETHKLTGFLRFSVMESNAMYAEFEPTSNCLAFLMPHFVNRMQSIPFLIHDKTYGQVAFWDTTEWFIQSSEGLTIPPYHPDEMTYRRLWKCFYDSVAIEGRINHNLRRQMMPKKYHKYLTELQWYGEESGTPAGIRESEVSGIISSSSTPDCAMQLYPSTADAVPLP